MRYALCTLDNVTHDAVGFNQLDNFANINNHLVCLECGVQARYQRQGRNGCKACFRAIHANGCSQARCHASTPYVHHVAENNTLTAAQRIIIEFIYGATTTGTGTQPAGGITDNVTQDDRQGGITPPRNTVNIRLSPLLNKLIDNADFSRSAATISIPGQVDYQVADFFVNFTDVTESHVGRYHGYWGEVTGLNHCGSKMCFNTGDGDNVNVCLDHRFYEETLQRFNFSNFDQVREIHILVFAELQMSPAGNQYIEITDPRHFTLRLKR